MLDEGSENLLATSLQLSMAWSKIREMLTASVSLVVSMGV